MAAVPIEKDGMYHFAAVEDGEVVRLSEDYFIEAQKYQPPEVKISRPGPRFQGQPIEEVTVAVDARDDFGLQDVDLHYSVNGGPEKAVPLLQAKGAKTSTGSTVLSIEDFKLQPGDVVSLYATAQGARTTAKTDMFFIQAEPFERNYTQSQQSGGGGGRRRRGRTAERDFRSARRKSSPPPGTSSRATAQGPGRRERRFLASVQSKLRDQATSLADRMKSRQLADAGDSFKSFVEDMQKAAAAMAPASDKLKGRQVAGRPGARAEGAAIPAARRIHLPRYPGGLRQPRRRRRGRGRRERRHARPPGPFRPGTG